jgi:ATP-dependent helicase/nuclease subunit A
VEVDPFPPATAQDVAGGAASNDARVRYTDFRQRYREAAEALAPVLEWEDEQGGQGASPSEDGHAIVFDADAARHGELLHALLERVTRYPEAFEGLPEPEVVMRWFPLAGAGTAQARALWRDQAYAAVEAARLMLEAPALRPLLFPQAALSARNEVELYDARGRLLRIDRLVEFADRVVIIDYKLRLLPQEHAAYAQQLARYVAAVRPIFPGRQVEAGVATADGEWIASQMLQTERQGSLF